MKSTKGTGGCDRPWVLNWRLELEETGNQTDRVYPVLFESKIGAVKYAVRKFRHYCRLFGCPAEKQEVHELIEDLTFALDSTVAGHVCYLTDSDNIVFELSRQKIRRRK